MDESSEIGFFRLHKAKKERTAVDDSKQRLLATVEIGFTLIVSSMEFLLYVFPARSLSADLTRV